MVDSERKLKLLLGFLARRKFPFNFEAMRIALLLLQSLIIAVTLAV